MLQIWAVRSGRGTPQIWAHYDRMFRPSIDTNSARPFIPNRHQRKRSEFLHLPLWTFVHEHDYDSRGFDDDVVHRWASSPQRAADIDRRTNGARACAHLHRVSIRIVLDKRPAAHQQRRRRHDIGGLGSGRTHGTDQNCNHHPAHDVAPLVIRRSVVFVWPPSEQKHRQHTTHLQQFSRQLRCRLACVAWNQAMINL
jgi:hypothetical protein